MPLTRVPIVAAVVLGVGAMGILAWSRHPRASRADPGITSWPPLPHRVQVEVLNAGGVPGAARVGAQLLRRGRLDVVYYGGADAVQSRRSGNAVLVRRGDTTGVGRVIEVLGNAAVVDAPDLSRLVDLTVLIGPELPGSHPVPR